MQPKPEMFVKFWGVRGSYPTPGRTTVQTGGNTPCVEVRAGDQLILLDAGTGLIACGRSLIGQPPVEATLLFSHLHHDHTQGFPFFAPAFVPSTRLHIFGPHTLESRLDQVLAQNMLPPVFPVTLQEMRAAKSIHSLGEGDCLVLADRERGPQVLPAQAAEGAGAAAVKVRVLRSYAHPGGVLVYRIEWGGAAVVYATDTEGYANTDRRLVDFARGADLLIHDAQYTDEHYVGSRPGQRATQGWGHSTARMACDVAQAAGAQRLALFHFDPTYDDAQVRAIERQAQRLFPAAFAAREGMCIRVYNGERPGSGPKVFAVECAETATGL